MDKLIAVLDADFGRDGWKVLANGKVVVRLYTHRGLFDYGDVRELCNV